MNFFKMKKYKQCKLKNNNIYTYKWVLSKIAIIGNKVFVHKQIFIIEKVYHYEENGKFIADYIDCII